MSRKVEMQKVWREGQRRSPRIFALEAAGNKSQSSSKSKATSFTATAAATTKTTAAFSAQASSQSRRHPRRPKKKRKLRPLHDVASTPPISHLEDPKICNVKDGRQLSHEDHPIDSNHPIMQRKNGQDDDQATYPGYLHHPDQSNEFLNHNLAFLITRVSHQSGQPLMKSCASRMPEKHILELVVDILQRRDTQDIFGEPVDPEEVENYYEIIKEPMDFGTIRAKLHEGMYNSLSHFEHDVFLITGNAMHFNSSATIYFRQVRTLNLPKRLWAAFLQEFFTKIRNFMLTEDVQARAIDKLAKEVFHLLKTDPENFEMKFSETRRRSSRRLQIEARDDISPKFMTCSTRSSSKLRRSISEHPSCSSITILSNERDSEVLFGGGDGGLSHSAEADKRSTYQPRDRSMYQPRDFLINQYHPTISTFYHGSEKLIHANQQDIGYNKSLILFVKDLGPTAKMIAKRKLNGWSSDACSFLTQGSKCWPKETNCRDWALTSAQKTAATPKTEITVTTTPNLGSGDRSNSCNADEGKRDHAGNKNGIEGTLMEVTAIKNDKNVCATIGEAHTGLSGVSGNDEFQHNPNSGIPLALKYSPSNSLACSWSSENYRFPLSAGMSSSHPKMLPTRNGNLQRLRPDDERSSSPFRFGLPFLKSRLDQINSLGRGRFSIGSSVSQSPFMDRMISGTCNDNDRHPHSSLDTRRLAVQL